MALWRKDSLRGFLFMHRWRKVWEYLILLGASVIGFAVGVVLHNVFYGFGKVTADITVLHYLFEFLHVAFFLIAIFVCPAGLLVGVVGSIVMAVVNFKKRRSAEKIK